MSHAIHRRGVAVSAGPPALELMIRHSREDYQYNVAPELRRRRYFVGHSEAGRRKAIRAANRHKPK